MDRTLGRAGALLVALSWAMSAAADAPADRAAEGRAIAMAFGAELRQALQAAMAEGGPLAAIEVCNVQAPQITGQAAQASGAEVGRTSQQLRNPGNAPDEHQLAVLERFASELGQAAEGQPPELLDVLPDGRVRYMRAIIVEPPCLACHGDALAPQVAEAIDALYPEDAARGYSVGQLRGAFTVTWPAAD